ncbi:MAG: methyltransferase family protein, partial [Actinomycetota bacterium]
MTTSAMSAERHPPAGSVLFDVMQSFVSSFAVIAAAELGIADVLAGGQRTAEEVAKAIDAHPASVGRLLRVLTPAGVVAETEPGRFGLTPMGASLQTGAAGGVAPGLQLLTRFVLRALAETPYSIRTGTPAFERVFGMPLYDFLEAHPE